MISRHKGIYILKRDSLGLPPVGGVSLHSGCVSLYQKHTLQNIDLVLSICTEMMHDGEPQSPSSKSCFEARAVAPEVAKMPKRACTEKKGRRL